MSKDIDFWVLDLYLFNYSAPYRSALSACAFSEVVSCKGRRFLQKYNTDCSFEENGYVVESRVAGRELFHVSSSPFFDLGL